MNTQKYEKLESYAAVRRVQEEGDGGDLRRAEGRGRQAVRRLKERIFRDEMLKDRAGRMAASSTRFARSTWKWACCPAPTDRRCSPAAKPRPW